MSKLQKQLEELFETLLALNFGKQEIDEAFIVLETIKL